VLPHDSSMLDDGVAALCLTFHERKRPVLPAFHSVETNEIVCPLTGELRGTHVERYGALWS
jgi:hypothetical protein